MSTHGAPTEVAAGAARRSAALPDNWPISAHLNAIPQRNGIRAPPAVSILTERKRAIGFGAPPPASRCALIWDLRLASVFPDAAQRLHHRRWSCRPAEPRWHSSIVRRVRFTWRLIGAGFGCCATAARRETT